MEDWMMLDNWGNPIPVSILDAKLTRVAGEAELGDLAQRNARVGSLLGKQQPGDTILWATSPDAQWEALQGSESIVLLRSGYVVDCVVLRMN